MPLSNSSGLVTHTTSPQSLNKVVKTTCFLANINDFAAFNEVYARMMPKTGAPSRSAVGIAALPKGAKVEIEAIAIR